jgi:hypothetical protein
MNVNFERMRKVAVVTETKCRLVHFPGGIEENHGNLNQDSLCPAEIQTDHLLNTNINRSHYANLLGNKILHNSTQFSQIAYAEIRNRGLFIMKP